MARSCWLALSSGLLLVGLAVAGPGASPGPAGVADPAAVAEFRRILEGTVDEAIGQVQAQEGAKTIPGVRPVEQLVVPGPRGLIALAHARETPDGTRWPVLILESTPKLEVSALFDVFTAYRVTRMVWSFDGLFLAVLTQSESLSGPGGQLAVLIPAEGRARLIDRDVFSFTMSPDGRHLVYEKSAKPGDLYGPRRLVHFDGATGKQAVIERLDYPRVQVGSMGDIDKAGTSVAVTLKDYSQGLTRVSDVRGTLDLVAGKLIRR